MIKISHSLILVLLIVSFSQKSFGTNKATTTQTSNDKNGNIIVDNSTKATLIPIAKKITNSFASNIIGDITESEQVQQAKDAYNNGDRLDILDDAKKNITNKHVVTGDVSDIKKPVIIKKSHQGGIYYLAAILYISPKNWSLWIDGKKLTNENPSQNNLKAITVDENHAEFILTIPKNDWPRFSEKSRIKQAFKERDKDIDLRFSLEPNQSFLVGDMKIVSGEI